MTPSVGVSGYGYLRFYVYFNEMHGVPHTHVRSGGETLAVMNRLTGEYIYGPPRGKKRQIDKAFKSVRGELLKFWSQHHGKG